MERILTALAAGLWAGTLSGIGLAYLVLAFPGKSSGQVTFAEKAMGEGLAMLGAGVLGGLLVFLLVAGGSYMLVPVNQLRASQSVSVAAILAMSVWGLVVLNRKAPERFITYAGVMDVEVRTPKSMFPAKRMNELLLVGLSMRIPTEFQYSGKVREDGDFVILTKTMRVPMRHLWEVTIASAGKGQLWFKLDWTDLPPGEIPWTEWIPPSQGEWQPDRDTISVRCRWRLAPFGAVRQ